MFALFRTLVGIAIPVFVLSTMLNVGLTQPPSRLLHYLRNRRFVLKMVVANFVAAPLLMILILRLTSLHIGVQAGLLVFALGAGAPFLIKLTRTAEHDIALGAATMLLLVVLTVGYMPLVLPRILAGMPVDAGAMTRSLLQMMIVPMVIGMLLAHFAPGFVGRWQPGAGGVKELPVASCQLPVASCQLPVVGRRSAGGGRRAAGKRKGKMAADYVQRMTDDR